MLETIPTRRFALQSLRLILVLGTFSVCLLIPSKQQQSQGTADYIFKIRRIKDYFLFVNLHNIALFKQMLKAQTNR